MPEAEHVIGFHAVLSGSCWAELGDGSVPAVQLSAGDVIILPGGVQHSLCSKPGMRAEPDLLLYYRPTDQPLPFVLQTGGGEHQEASGSPAAISDATENHSIRSLIRCRM